MVKNENDLISRVYIYIFAISFSYLLIDYVNILYMYFIDFSSIKFKTSTLIIYGFFYMSTLFYLFLKAKIYFFHRLFSPFLFFYFYIFVLSLFRGENILEVIKMSLWLVMFVVGLYWGRFRNNRFIAFFNKRVLLIVFFPLAIYVIYLLLNNPLINPDIYFIIIIFVPYLFRIEKIKTRTVLLVIMAVFILISLKRSLILACLFSLLYYWAGKKNLKFLFFCVCVLIGLFFLSSIFFPDFYERFASLSEDGGSGRDSIYSSILNHLWEDPSLLKMLFGYGEKSTLSFIGMYAHNDFLQILSDFGLIGLLIYIYAILNFLFKMRVLAYSECREVKIYKSTLLLLLPLVSFNCLIYHPFYLILIMFPLGITCGILIKNHI